MTPRNAAIRANQIYTLWETLDYEARCANVREYSRLLGNLAPFMSQTQLAKLDDWDHGVAIYHKARG